MSVSQMSVRTIKHANIDLVHNSHNLNLDNNYDEFIAKSYKTLINSDKDMDIHDSYSNAGNDSSATKFSKADEQRVSFYNENNLGEFDSKENFFDGLAEDGTTFIKRELSAFLINSTPISAVCRRKSNYYCPNIPTWGASTIGTLLQFPFSNSGLHKDQGQ